MGDPVSSDRTNARTEMLQADPNAVRLAVEALSFFFVESAKKNAGSLDFIDSALLGGFDADVANYLYAQFQANVKMLRTTLGKMSMELPQYHNLEWRLDVQVASRSLHRQLNPTYLVQLDIKDGDGALSHALTWRSLTSERFPLVAREAVRPHLLQTDPASLNHLTQALETALNEMKTAYARRIVRNIK